MYMKSWLGGTSSGSGAVSWQRHQARCGSTKASKAADRLSRRPPFVFSPSDVELRTLLETSYSTLGGGEGGVGGGGLPHPPLQFFLRRR